MNAKFPTVLLNDSAEEQRRSQSLLSRRHMWRKTGRNIVSREPELMMETDTDKSINPETDVVNKLGNPNPTLHPYEPAQSEDGPCDLTIKQPNTSGA